MRDVFGILGIIAGVLVLIAGFIAFLMWLVTVSLPSVEEEREQSFNYYTTCVESGGSYSESSWDGSPRCEK